MYWSPLHHDLWPMTHDITPQPKLSPQHVCGLLGWCYGKAGCGERNYSVVAMSLAFRKAPWALWSIALFKVKEAPLFCFVLNCFVLFPVLFSFFCLLVHGFVFIVHWRLLFIHPWRELPTWSPEVQKSFLCTVVFLFFYCLFFSTKAFYIQKYLFYEQQRLLSVFNLISMFYLYRDRT